MPHNLQSIAEFISARLIGDGNIQVEKVATPAQARAGDLVFVQSEKHLEAALSSQASAVIAGEFASAATGRKPLLLSRQPRYAFGQAAALLHPPPMHPASTHPTAMVHPSARIAPSASIDAYAVVEANAVVGERTHIAAGAFLGDGAVVGNDCDIYPRVVIYSGTTLGNRVIVHAGAVLGSDGFGFVPDEVSGRYVKFPQIGTLVIGDDVEIGANCTIDRGALEKTVIGAGTKLDNLVHIGHNSTVGSNVVMAAQTGVSGSASIEDSVIVGGQVGIADHVTIGSGAILGAQCGVPSNKTIRGKGVVFWGTPARPIREYLKELAVLARLARK
jgi:UDP-3-O-[3-hydroxymyristoyl] glucosamine N-acyltransferase